MKINTSVRTITITNEHPVFAGTDYAKSNFTIDIVTSTSTQRSELLKRFTNNRRGVDVVDHIGFGAAFFDRTVKGWTGIELTDDGPSECTKENKALVFDFALEFANLIQEAANIEGNRIEAERKAETKN